MGCATVKLAGLLARTSGPVVAAVGFVASEPQGLPPPDVARGNVGGGAVGAGGAIASAALEAGTVCEGAGGRGEPGATAAAGGGA